MLDLPAEPPHALSVRDSGVLTFDGPVWRIYLAAGSYPNTWSSFRVFGPLLGSRWDPHSPPAREQNEHAIYDAADRLETCVCEFFQAGRAIDLDTFAPHLTGWKPSRPLRLLDLTGPWPTRNGGSGALAASPDRATTQGWARAIRRDLPEIDGIYARATTTQLPTVTLWGPGARAKLPGRPAFDRPLISVLPEVVAIAGAYGYDVIGSA